MLNALSALRSHAGKAYTHGIRPNLLARFENDVNLQQAVQIAADQQSKLLRGPFASLIKGDEKECLRQVQYGFLNFYSPGSINPYVPIGAKGPWIITSHGAVIYDAGGYDMLGVGHNNDALLHAISAPQCQANIMTAQFNQLTFMNALRKEVGHNRKTCPYDRFICLNSGSESVTMAMRVSDVHAKRMTDKGGVHEGWDSIVLALKGSFHGRTERPATASDSCQPAYRTNLSTFKGYQLQTILPNDIADLHRVFENATRTKKHIEILLMEPVMGEGNPGLALTREFYDEARRLTRENHSLLLLDSIQAGLRTTGCLSHTDAAGFETCAPPDFETYSKAINGGQYPLSVLAMGAGIPELYVLGLYGNTMTTNPRALDVATAMLGMVTPEMRKNIITSGHAFKTMLQRLHNKHPKVLEDVSGSGLLIAAHVNEKYHVHGEGSVEELARRHGLGVIHGGKNALRFTPWFNIDAKEIELVSEILDETFTVYHNKHK